MALIHVYNGLTTTTTYNYNGKLKDKFKINWNNAIILKAGYRIDENYEAQESDIIYIRKTPAASVSVGAAIFGTVAGAIMVSSLAYGVNQYENKKKQAQLEAQEMQEKIAELQNSITSVNNEDPGVTSRLPYIKGAQNTPATGRSFPYIIGETLMTPYRLCPPHYTIGGERGEDQYFNTVLEVAYNDILIKKIKIGETSIKDFIGYTTPQNGEYSFDGGVFYDSRNKIEIRQTGAFADDEFNKKIIWTELNEEIPHDHAGDDPAENQRIEQEWKAGVVQELPNHAKSVELIALFDGLQKYDNGLWQDQSITLRPQWTNVNNPSEDDWHDFTNGFNQNGTYSNTFTYNTRKQMRYAAKQEFTAAQAFNKVIKIRIQRTTPKTSKSARDNVYILATQTTCYDEKKSNGTELVTAEVLEPNERDKCCRIGVRIAANANTKGLLNSINVVAAGCARTWNGSTWSSTKTPTRNLAAWALEILTSPHHRASRYNDDELELASFGAWYIDCQQHGFNSDGVIARSTKKKTVLETLCQNSNAALVYNTMTGKMEVALDNGRDYSVALLNSENIISISTTKEIRRKSDGKKVTYINRAGNYAVDNVTFMRDGGAYDPANDILTETALEFITDYQHAYKYAWRQMAEELAQPNIVTIKAGLESAYYPLFSRVEVQHRTFKKGLAHGIIKRTIWHNNILQQIQLDGSVTFPATGACGLIVNCVSDNGRGLLTLKVSGSGKTNILNVLTHVNYNDEIIPTAGNNCSFGQLDADGGFTTVTTSMKIVNAEETDNGYTLTLVDYNPALYQYGELPEYKSNLTSIPNGIKQTVEQQREYVAPADVNAAGNEAAQAAVDTITKGGNYTNVYKIKPVEMTLEDIIKKMDDDARNTSASISMSADEILLQVNDMERELVGLLDIQAGAVTALVEGGGASGQMSLSLNLPVIINANMRNKLIAASTTEKVNAVYSLIENTSNYGIKGNASNTDVKALWDDAVKNKLLASQIVLQADQIYIDGDVILNNEHKIKAALIDVENIFAQEIEIKQNGVLKSSNYIENQQGFKLTDTELEVMSGKFNGSIQNGIIDVTGALLIPFSYNGTISQADPYLELTSDWSIVTASENPYRTGATRRRSYKTEYYDVNKRYLGYQITAYYEYDIDTIDLEIQLDAYTKAVTRVTNIEINGYIGNILGEFKLHNIPDARNGDNISNLDHDEIYVDNNGFLKRVN